MSRTQPLPQLDWFIANAERLKIEPGDTFLSCYPYLLRAFERLVPEQSSEDLVLAAHAVYGWMPTILDLRLDGEPKPTEAVGLLRAGAEQATAIEALTTLFHCIGTLSKKRGNTRTKRGKSIVGVSKLLHFLMPDQWPIWDSKVKRIWPLGSILPVGYWHYTQRLRELAAQADGIAARVNQALQDRGYDYQVTPLRALEMVMFYREPSK